LVKSSDEDISGKVSQHIEEITQILTDSSLALNTKIANNFLTPSGKQSMRSIL
jgi:hypothetical protein